MPGVNFQSDQMKKIFSTPNLSILFACLAWFIMYFAALSALGDPKPVDPSIPNDEIRFEKQIEKKDLLVKSAMILSIVFAISPYLLAFRRWGKAKIRFSLSMVISLIFFGMSAYYIFVT
jgi:hypothetical protein